MAVYLYYDEDKNPGGGTIQPGVPLANITDEEFKSYAKWVQVSLEAHPAYQKTNPHPEHRATESEAAGAGKKQVAKPAEKPADKEG